MSQIPFLFNGEGRPLRVAREIEDLVGTGCFVKEVTPDELLRIERGEVTMTAEGIVETAKGKLFKEQRRAVELHFRKAMMDHLKAVYELVYGTDMPPYTYTELLQLIPTLLFNEMDRAMAHPLHEGF